MHVGCNIYHWGDREQNRLLHHCLGPLEARLEARHLCRRFWFGRFDARGPLSATELQARHLACRGKTLCAADHPSEPPSNNTVVLCDHGPRDYPALGGARE